MVDLDLMDGEALRQMQALLSKRYREMPDATLMTLKAQGRLGEGIVSKAETRKPLTDTGLHAAINNNGVAMRAGDIFLEALVACADVTLAAVAATIGVELRDATIRAEGDLDFRGTLGTSKKAIGGFQRIRLYFDLDTDAPYEQIATLIRLTERHCVILQTLRQVPEVTTTSKKVIVGWMGQEAT